MLPEAQANQLGSKRLQLNRGGGATPFLLRDLDCGDEISTPPPLHTTRLTVTDFISDLATSGHSISNWYYLDMDAATH